MSCAGSQCCRAQKYGLLLAILNNVKRLSAAPRTCRSFMSAMSWSCVSALTFVIWGQTVSSMSVLSSSELFIPFDWQSAQCFSAVGCMWACTTASWRNQVQVRPIVSSKAVCLDV